MHPRIDRLHTAYTDARVNSSCHERHEDRLTTQHSSPTLPKHDLIDLPLQAGNDAHEAAITAQLSFLTVTGPAPLLLRRSPSRAPPLAQPCA